MAHDGSMASKVEAWIVAQLETLAPFADRNVEVFPGSTDPAGAKLIAELTSKDSPYVVVMFEGDQARPLEEGEHAYDPTYGIYVTVSNQRPSASRTGDGTTIGTNGLRDLIRNALHDEYPNVGANGFFTERVQFRGVKTVFQRTDAYIIRAEVVIRETPAAV